MASLPIAFGATVVATKRRTFTTAATKGSAGPPEEKSLLDFVIGAIMKEDQVLVETDPLLNKVEGKAAPSGGTRGKTAPAGGTRGKGTVQVPAKKKNGGFGIGGLFAKN